MKKAIFLVNDYGVDGRGEKYCVFASECEKERDNWYNESVNKNFYSKEDVVADLDEVARNVWNKLDSLEKLSLEREDCILWVRKLIKKMGEKCIM